MINYSKQYFGKNLEDLEYLDVANYFVEEKEESDKIEFKAFHSSFGNFNKNLEGVIRAACAFLNSNGGILIWGAPLGVKVEEKVIFKGELALVNKLIEKDSIISKISDSITPLPVNINVQIIEQDSSYLYIFEIQISSYSPHQFKNTYWARLDGQTKPAPHYLIDALFKKVTYPNIEGYINLDKYGNYGDDKVYLDISIFMINFSELQNEYNITYTITCGQAIFEGFLNPHLRKYYSLEGHGYINKDIDILHYGAPITNSQKLIIDLSLLADNYNYEMSLVLGFGGKKSPLKLSEYKLKFGGSVAAKNPVGLFHSKEENILSVEKQRELGTTREIFLEKLLRR